MATPIQHGGALDRAISAHGGERADWLDLSTGINPVAWPVPDLPNEAWQRLPDDAPFDACLIAAKRYYGVPEGAAIVAAPGTQAIIQWLPSVLSCAPVNVVTPTYGEYQRCFGDRVVAISEMDDATAPVVIVGNPNNPDGCMVTEQAVCKQLDRGATVVIDEAFADVAPEHSVIGLTDRAGVLVLRSFGKFFGLAGVRLGFAIGDAKLVSAIASYLGPWAVSGPALQIAQRALSDSDWIVETRMRLARDRSRLEILLTKHGFEPVGATNLFVTVSRPDAQDVYHKLASRRILVRPFDGTSWLRFGLAADQAGFDRLETALAGGG